MPRLSEDLLECGRGTVCRDLLPSPHCGRGSLKRGKESRHTVPLPHSPCVVFRRGQYTVRAPSFSPSVRIRRTGLCSSRSCERTARAADLSPCLHGSCFGVGGATGETPVLLSFGAAHAYPSPGDALVPERGARRATGSHAQPRRSPDRRCRASAVETTASPGGSCQSDRPHHAYPSPGDALVPERGARRATGTHAQPRRQPWIGELC